MEVIAGEVFSGEGGSDKNQVREESHQDNERSERKRPVVSMKILKAGTGRVS